MYDKNDCLPVVGSEHSQRQALWSARPCDQRKQKSRHTRLGRGLNPHIDCVDVVGSTLRPQSTKKERHPNGCLSFLVPVVGVEPTRYRYHWILSPARLPIPSHRRMNQPCQFTLNEYIINIFSSQYLLTTFLDFFKIIPRCLFCRRSFARPRLSVYQKLLQIRYKVRVLRAFRSRRRSR